MQKLVYLEEGVSPVWSPEISSEISSLLEQKYLPFLQDERFTVESGQTRDQVQIRVTLLKRDSSLAYPIECVYPVAEEMSGTPEDVAFLMLDYLDVYWREYLSEGRDTFIPIDWTQHTCEGVQFYMRGFVRNLQLENESDELFRKFGNGEYDIRPISSDE